MTSQGTQTIPTDQRAAQGKERFMDLGVPLESDAQPPELVQPRERALYDPPVHAQTTAMWRATFGQDRLDAALAQRFSVGFGIIAPIPLEICRCKAS